MAARLRVSWPELLITSGLAAAVTALGGIALEATRESQLSDGKDCELVTQLLQDESWTPYLDAGTAKRVARDAADRFSRCARE